MTELLEQMKLLNEDHTPDGYPAVKMSEINELIDANIQERVRAMGRSIKAVQAYSLRGAQHAAGMLEHLNSTLSNKGIFVKRVIITNVVLS